MPAPPGVPSTLSSTTVAHPPKISGTGQSYGPPAPGTTGAKEAQVTDEATQAWTTFATALGIAAPAHVTRLQRTTQALRRYGG